MAMEAFVDATPDGWKSKLKVWRSTTDGAGEDCGAAITIPEYVPSDDLLIGFLGLRARVTGDIVAAGSEGFRITLRHGGATFSLLRMLSSNGYTDRVTAESYDNDAQPPVAWGGISSAGTFGLLNHVLTFTSVKPTYSVGTNVGGLLQWVEVWFVPTLPTAGLHLV